MRVNRAATAIKANCQSSRVRLQYLSMGAKYNPSAKDLKASQRYQNNQQRKARAHSPATTSPQPVRAPKKSGR